jgi:hypothetical protein
VRHGGGRDSGGLRHIFDTYHVHPQ